MAAALAATRTAVAEAATAAGRDPAGVTLIAVTKTFPASDVAILAALGQLDVGENRDQEARAKQAELADPAGLRWHLVGQLQTNKARSVAGYATAVHSVDRTKLVTALARAAAELRDTPLDVFCQVNLDPEPESDAGRGGVAPDRLAELADAVAASPALRLCGVMAVAPRDTDAAAAFARLAALSAAVRAQHPAAGAISAGMSGDFPVAIRYGATHVRIGSALLGHRASQVG